MLIAAAMLCLCVYCQLRLRHWAILREQARGDASGETPMGGSILAGLTLVAREPVLRWMAAVLVCGVGVGTLLYNAQIATVRELYPDSRDATAYFANIDLAINALALFVQVFITRWLLSRYGIAPALLLPPLAIFIGYALLAASPLPLLLAVVQVVTRSGEFCLHKPARETVYTKVPREWRYKAGAAIDTVIYRGADLAFGWSYKAIGLLGGSAVFGAGMLIALAFGYSGYRLWREQDKLPTTPR
jgi:AAA family ATP:ADP antiporter